MKQVSTKVASVALAGVIGVLMMSGSVSAAEAKKSGVHVVETSEYIIYYDDAGNAIHAEARNNTSPVSSGASADTASLEKELAAIKKKNEGLQEDLQKKQSQRQKLETELKYKENEAKQKEAQAKAEAEAKKKSALLEELKKENSKQQELVKQIEKEQSFIQGLQTKLKDLQQKILNFVGNLF